MKNIKVCQRLQLIEPQEMKYLARFINSDYFSQDKSMRRLFAYFKKHHPDFSGRTFSEENAHEAAFPKKPYGLKRLLNKCSDLCLLVDKYLLYEAFNADAIEQNSWLSKALLRRKNAPFFLNQLAKTQKLNDEQALADETQSLRKMQLSFLEYFNPAYQKLGKNVPELFQRMITQTEEGFNTLRLRIAIEYWSQKQNKKWEFPEPFQDLKLLKVEDNQSVVFQLYLKTYQLITSKEKNEQLRFFLELKQQFFANETVIAKEVANTVASNLMNYLTRFIGLHPNLTHENAFALAKKLYKGKHLEEEGIFPAGFFSNIIILASILGETEWMKTFLAYGEETLDEANKQNTINKGYAYLSFAEKEYDTALSHLIKIPTNDLADKLQVAPLELKCYYELRNSDLDLDYKLNAFAALIKRQKDLDNDFIEKNLNFKKFVKKLYQCPSKKERQALVEEIHDTSTIARQWLLEKARE